MVTIAASGSWRLFCALFTRSNGNCWATQPPASAGGYLRVATHWFGEHPYHARPWTALL